MSEVVKGSDTETFRKMMVAVVLIMTVLASLIVVSAYFHRLYIDCTEKLRRSCIAAQFLLSKYHLCQFCLTGGNISSKNPQQKVLQQEVFSRVHFILSGLPRCSPIVSFSILPVPFPDSDLSVETAGRTFTCFKQMEDIF